jgi:ssDNA-binding Zn-finger/Zn-ribbon topoisomerase 1
LPNHHAQELLEENCPLCGKPLAVRYNRRGQKFIGCTGFPKCHYVRTFGMTDEEYQKEKAAKMEAKTKGTKYTPVTKVGKQLAAEQKKEAPAKTAKTAKKIKK